MVVLAAVQAAQKSPDDFQLDVTRLAAVQAAQKHWK